METSFDSLIGPHRLRKMVIPLQNRKGATPMATVSDRTPPSGSDSEIPPLEAGDRLSRAEFERRYKAIPSVKKAELIEGVVYVASPGQLYGYGVPCAHLITWLGMYRGSTPGVIGADNASDPARPGQRSTAGRGSLYRPGQTGPGADLA